MIFEIASTQLDLSKDMARMKFYDDVVWNNTDIKDRMIRQTPMMIRNGDNGD